MGSAPDYFLPPVVRNEHPRGAVHPGLWRPCQAHPAAASDCPRPGTRACAGAGRLGCKLVPWLLALLISGGFGWRIAFREAESASIHKRTEPQPPRFRYSGRLCASATLHQESTRFLRTQLRRDAGEVVPRLRGRRRRAHGRSRQVRLLATSRRCSLS